MIPFFVGPSQIDGSPIVALATGTDRPSKNRKVGDMIQTWIVRADLSPTAAVAMGADYAICGACPHRGDGTGAERSCYVVLCQAPTSAWKAWVRAGRPSAVDPRTIGSGRLVRLGAYGDPFAVPLPVWQRLLSLSAGWTGYTHHWRRGEAEDYKGLCMASVDSEEEQWIAESRGWRTFRVSTGSERSKGEAPCPAYVSENRIQCETCLLCAGTSRRGPSIIIPAHGTGACYV